jgi:uridine phosphorylase
MADVFHLGLTRDQLGGAGVALLPGDPARVSVIAGVLPGEAVEAAANREFRTWVVRGPAGAVAVTSTGIGGPSTAIAVEELAQLGVHTFIRVGTTGAIQARVAVADVVITTGAVRLDGASSHYAPLEYPAVADHHVTHALIEAAQEAGIPYHAGITASSDTFYPGQERYDTFSGYVLRRFQGSAEEWRRLGVLNYEMESATLFVVAATLGLRAGCVAGVLVNRTLAERVDETTARPAERNAITVATRAALRLIDSGGRPG